MPIDVKIKNNKDGGFSIVVSDDGSGDLNRVMGELCRQHKEAQRKGEETKPQTPGETLQEILQDISEEEEAALNVELDKYDVD